MTTHPAPIVRKQTYASPMSFVGGTRRVAAWANRGSTGASVGKWTVAALGLAFFYAFLSVWYVVVFGLFGIITIPLRIHRRGQRKAQAVHEAQLAEMRRIASREENR